MSKNLIQKLKDRYDLARLERQKKEDKERPMKDRMEVIFSSPLYVNTDFWCDVCKKDCAGPGHRRVNTVNESWPYAWYVGFCPKGHKMMRFITDKLKDPYYEQSDFVRRQRFEMRDEFLTPEDPRFKLLYPKQYEELMGHK